jgi:uncharacterized membrane protein
MSEAEVASIIVAVTSAHTGMLLALICLPMAMGKVSPNRWYGFRTKKTMSDPTIWYETNRFSGRAGVVAGVFILISAITLGVFGHGVEWATHLQIGIALGAVMVMLVYSLWRLKGL